MLSNRFISRMPGVNIRRIHSRAAPTNTSDTNDIGCTNTIKDIVNNMLKNDFTIVTDMTE